jgi:hypothetical protein
MVCNLGARRVEAPTTPSTAVERWRDGGTMSKRRVLEEIAKCELVCANCHAIPTMQRRDLGV